MDLRAEKIAKARQKLKDHQEKKGVAVPKEELVNKISVKNNESQHSGAVIIKDVLSNDNDLKINDNQFLHKTSGDNNLRQKSDVTEILISTKTDLEMQIKNLTEKLSFLENLYRLETSNHKNAKQKVHALEQELSSLSQKHTLVLQDDSLKNDSLADLKNMISKIKEENQNLIEQLEFTKSMLTANESENAQLQNKICSYQNQLDVVQLQVQQLTNNCMVQPEQSNKGYDEVDTYVKKIASLEQAMESLQKERDQINSHYEHYVKELNGQLKNEAIKNEKLTQEIQNLYNRENSLIEQISDLEIRLQNYKIKLEDINYDNKANDMEIQNKYQEIQGQFGEINAKYENLQIQYMDSLTKIQELSKVRETECSHDNISINKLNADIASDKIAAQRATEQNKKLKSDVEDLEQVVVKMGKDKLELTEMWTHEKQLNKGLSLKLAEIEENVKNMLKQLKAKDEEMIRLQNENRELKRKHEDILEANMTQHVHECTEKDHSHVIVEAMCHNHNENHEEKICQSTPLLDGKALDGLDINIHNMIIPKQDAMTKLQERFLNIMDQVANLSDEKHRLEHIILQLQNETDTICEYVALYQQQRSLLKKREEERSNQLKIYQMECDKLKRHLVELQGLLLKFASDHELEKILKEERRHNDLTRVKELLEKLQNCSLINPKFKNFDLNIFYPCSCCSGQVIVI